MATPQQSSSSQTVTLSESTPEEKQKTFDAQAVAKKEVNNKKRRDKNASKNDGLHALCTSMKDLEKKIPLFAPEPGERNLYQVGVLIEGKSF